MKIEHFVVETDWLNLVKPKGWGNGYVALEKGHPCFGMDCNDIERVYDVEAHGGLTLSVVGCSSLHRFPSCYRSENWWIIGFDTFHYHDTIDNWPKEAVEREALKIRWRMMEVYFAQQRTNQAIKAAKNKETNN